MPVITEESAPQLATRSHRSRSHAAKAQAVAIQRVLLADALNTELQPKDRAIAARAWVDLEETKRKLSMKPLPGSLRPVSAAPKRKAQRMSAPALAVKQVTEQVATVSKGDSQGGIHTDSIQARLVTPNVQQSSEPIAGPTPPAAGDTDAKPIGHE